MADTLRVGQELAAGQSLEYGAYKLTLQQDGNLVLSEPGDTAVWASGTHGKGVDKAVLQSDGNFVLYAGDRGEWSTETDGKSADRLTVQPDRNVVLYGTDGAALWAANTKTDNPIVVEEPAAPVAEEVAPPVEEAPAPPPPPAPRTYTVEPGDTLWAVAERFYGDGNRYQEIANASGVPNPDSIGVGQVLTIP